MSKDPKHVETSNVPDEVFIIQLLQTWLVFLERVAKYADRYYLSRDLELAPQEQNPASEKAMKRYYGTIDHLNGAIESDLNALPKQIHEIEAAQVACSLPHFPLREEYVERIIMGFSIHERHGKERRAYYRRRVRSMQKRLNEGKVVEPLSLNMLEKQYMKCRDKADKRAAEKAARIEQETQDVQAAMKAAYDEETNTVHLPK